VTLAHFFALQGKTQEAGDRLRLAERTSGEPSTLRRCDFHMVRAALRASTGRLAGAFEDYEAAIGFAREIGEPEQVTWALGNYASRELATGHTQRALERYREAVANAPADEFGKVGALAQEGLASALMLSGDLAAARAAHAAAGGAGSTMVLMRSARLAFALRLLYLDDEALPFDDASLAHAMELALRSGETQNIGLLAGSLAACYDAAGRGDEAQQLRTRALEAIASTDLSFWLLDQLAGSPRDDERARARLHLAAAARDEANLAARAHFALFDARIAARGRRIAASKALAVEAADRFAAIGWPWERAAALELAGRPAQAREIYEAYGYRRQLRQLDEARRRARHRAGRDRLTPREREVVELAAAGLSNREIGARLFIGERTVETHVAAVFDRFDLTSRRQLATLLSPSETE
jgi:DNA-binding CsgD family transcriptional regulator